MGTCVYILHLYIYIYEYLHTHTNIYIYIYTYMNIQCYKADVVMYAVTSNMIDGQLIATEACLTSPFAWWLVDFLGCLNTTNIHRDHGSQNHCSPLANIPSVSPSISLQQCLPGSLPSEVGTAWDPETCSVARSIRRQLPGSSNWRRCTVWSWSTSWLPRWLHIFQVLSLKESPASESSKDLPSMGLKKTCCFNAGRVLKVRLWFVKQLHFFFQ